MIAPPMLYALLIALLMSLAAWTLERVAAAFGRPRRTVWAAALVASFTLPACMILIGYGQPAQTNAWTPAWEMSTEPDLESPPPVRRIEPVPAQPSNQQSTRSPWTLPPLPNLDSVLVPLWIATSLVLLSVLSISWIRLLRVTRNLQRGQVDGVSVYIADGIGPAAFGLVRPTIILPTWVVNAPEATRAMVLAHELAHVRARDPLLFTLALLLVCLAPWNVPLWWQLRRLRFAVEVDCDQRVLREGVDVSAYGEMLLTVWQRHSGFPIGAVALIERVSQLEKRIQIMTTRRTRPALLLAACGIGATSFVIAAAQLEPPAVSSSTAESTSDERPPSTGVFRAVPLEELDDTATGGESSDNRVLFMQEGDNSPHAAEMRRRLQDPEERLRLRAEQRARVREEHPELAQVLQLGSSTEAELIELLTDERMDHLERFWLTGLGAARPNPSLSAFGANMQEHADAETRRLAKVQDLLGEHGFGQYQDYKQTVHMRVRAIQFNARLGPADKLAADQKERLINLLHDQQVKDLARFSADSGDLRDLLGQPGNREMMRKQMFRREAEHIRDLEEASRELLERLPAVLTPAQIGVYAQMEAEKLATQHRHLKSKLARAGLTLEELQQSAPAPSAPPRKPVSEPFRLDVYLEVNGKPVEISAGTENGKTVSFQAPEGLWVEARPTLYDTGWLYVELKYYEGPPGRRREISGGAQGTQIRPNQRGARSGGGGSTMITGSKGYAISVGVNAAPLATGANPTVTL